MENENDIIKLIKQRQSIPKDKVELIKIKGEGNCLFRTFLTTYIIIKINICK